MTISELSVRRPVMMSMVYAVIIIIALVFLPQLDIALYPSVDMPVLSVMVSCNDAGPDEIEQQVAKVLESSFGSLENLQSMTTRSSEGSAMIMLEFSYGTDLDSAYDDVVAIANRLSRQLPDWADTPSVMRMDMSGNSTVVRFIVSGDATQEKLLQTAEETVLPLLERVSGVSEASVRGGGDQQFTVSVSANRLEAYGLQLSQVSSAIASRNIQGNGGTITQDGMNYQVGIDTRYTDIDQIMETVVSTVGGIPVLVQDIADVVLESSSATNESYLDGKPIVSVSVSNDSDSNASTVAAAVIAMMDEINSQLPEGTVLTLQQDSSQMISSTMDEVYTSAIEGVILAALVIFLFLRGFKATLIIALSMPICILITLMFMAMFGITVNMMSMSGLILGIGMIVDASIIILENTYAYRATGYKSSVAAILGSKNMFNAIVASTLTTLCVFVPLLLYRYDLGMIGMMFQDLVITVCISLISSLFVAVTLVPALAGSILRINTRTQKPLKHKLLRSIDGACAWTEERMRDIYEIVLRYFLNHRFLLIVLLVVLLMFSLTKFSGVGMSLTPQMNSDDSVTLSLTLEPGTNSTITKKYLFDMQQQIIDTLPANSYGSILVSVSGSGMMSSASNEGTIEISLPDITEQTVSAAQVKELLRPLLTLDPQATWVFSAGRGPGSGSAIDIEIKSEDSTTAKETADMIASVLLAQVPQLTNIETDLANGAPKISVDIDQRVAQDLGINMATVSTILANAIGGITASEVTTLSADNTYDIIVQLEAGELTSIEDLGSLLIPTNSTTVRLDSVATLSMSTAPMTITRENKVRVNHVTASLRDGYTASEVQQVVNTVLAEQILIPDGVTISQGGEMSQFEDYSGTLVMIILISLLLVYAVMAAQFESMLDPLIIFATIPLLLIGVVWIHLTMAQAFSLFSIVGIVALIGVVVNNGIVLVDSINQLVREHVPVRKACVLAARRRLRPILMTTLTTVLGMIPLAFFPGDGAEMMQPIALTFIGGLLTGATLTLILSPVLYSLLNSHKERHYDDPDSLQNQLREYDISRLTTLEGAQAAQVMMDEGEEN